MQDMFIHVRIIVDVLRSPRDSVLGVLEELVHFFGRPLKFVSNLG